MGDMAFSCNVGYFSDQNNYGRWLAKIRQKTIAKENKHKLFHTTVVPGCAFVVVNDVAIADVVSVVATENVVVGVVELVVEVSVAFLVVVDGVVVVVVSVVTTGDVVVFSLLGVVVVVDVDVVVEVVVVAVDGVLLWLRWM